MVDRPYHKEVPQSVLDTWTNAGRDQAKADAKTNRPIGALAPPTCNDERCRIAFLNGYQDGMKVVPRG